MNKLQKERERPIGLKIDHEEIARRAYELWEASGRPAGRDLEYWLQAEAGIAATRSSRGGVGGSLSGTKARA